MYIATYTVLAKKSYKENAVSVENEYETIGKRMKNKPGEIQ